MAPGVPAIAPRLGQLGPHLAPQLPGRDRGVLGDTDLVVLDGDHCRADHLNGCKPKISPPRTGGTPNFAAVDPTTGTVYVANLQESTVSLAKDEY